jgi:TolB-like protein
MIYKGVDYFTSSKKTSNKISIAVLSFDNIRELKEYNWLEERIARNLSFKLGELSEIRTIDRLQILNKLGEIDPDKASVMDYKINQIAKNIDVDLILHGSFTIMDKDNIIEINAVLADINTAEQISLMLEQYPLDELSDIPSYINEKITLFIKSDQRFKQTLK